MSAKVRASARWRQKKLDENAREFRAKEALRLKKYRAQVKGKCRRPQANVEVDNHVLKGVDELSDDVEAWLIDVVDNHPPSRSQAFSQLLSAPPSPSWSSSTRSHNKHETLHEPSTTITIQHAHEIIINSERTLQEWSEGWGTSANFLYRAVNSCLDIGPTTMPADRVEEELMVIVRKGRESLLQLESIAFVDLCSVQANEFRTFWIDAVRVIQGLSERLAQADTVLRLRSDMQT